MYFIIIIISWKKVDNNNIISFLLSIVYTNHHKTGHGPLWYSTYSARETSSLCRPSCASPFGSHCFCHNHFPVAAGGKKLVFTHATGHIFCATLHNFPCYWILRRYVRDESKVLFQESSHSCWSYTNCMITADQYKQHREIQDNQPCCSDAYTEHYNQ